MFFFFAFVPAFLGYTFRANHFLLFSVRFPFSRIYQYIAIRHEWLTVNALQCWVSIGYRIYIYIKIILHLRMFTGPTSLLPAGHRRCRKSTQPLDFGYRGSRAVTGGARLPGAPTGVQIFAIRFLLRLQDVLHFPANICPDRSPPFNFGYNNELRSFSDEEVRPPPPHGSIHSISESGSEMAHVIFLRPFR